MNLPKNINAPKVSVISSQDVINKPPTGGALYLYMKPSEQIMLNLIKEGELIIDNNGCFWKQSKDHGLVRAEQKTPNGYLLLRKMVDLKRYIVGAHRISHLYFNGAIPIGKVINHDDGIKHNNFPANLDVMTHGENMSHAYRTGLRSENGEKNPNAKLKANEIKEIRDAYSKGGITQAALSKIYNVSYQHISKIVRGEKRSLDSGPVGDYTDRRNINQHRNKKGQFI